MFLAPFENVVVLTGPTASGKTALGIELAERLGAEIVSMDSMALYRGMDIGTAKPSAAERRRVPHHLIDVLDPWQSSSVAWWREQAAASCREIEGRGKRVLFVGGTPLYLKALLHGLFDGPPADPDLRQRLDAEAERAGRAALHERLARVDPVAAARLHPNDLHRVIRALEVWELTGRPISAWQQQWGVRSSVRSEEEGVRSEEEGVRSEEEGVRSEEEGVRSEEEGVRSEEEGEEHGSRVARPSARRPPTPHSSLLTPHSSLLTPPSSLLTPHCLYLDLPRAELYARINERVLQMIAAGLADEVQALRRLPHPLSREAAQAVGYQEMAAFLDGQATLEETIRRIQTRSRHFAKRQLTWFRHLPDCRPVTKELTFGLEGLTIK